MRLTLDWDSEQLEKMHRPAVRNRSPANENQQRIAEYHDGAPSASDKWELWRSSGHGHGGEDDGDGYHYVEYDLGGGLEDMRRLRRTYGDDALRTGLDGKRMEWGSPYIGVLYHLKNIKRSEKSPPYSTGKRAELVERHGFGSGDGGDPSINTKNEDGTLNYPEIIRALADHPDFGSRAALYRAIQGRESVDVDTRPTARAYDHLNGRRPIQRSEKKALRDYANSRGLGHYSKPPAVDGKPTRTTYHEYWEMPEVEFDQQDFGGGDTDSGGDSEDYPVNIRTGTYGDPDETTVRQVHDAVADQVVETLSPGVWQDGDNGREYHGLDLSRWGYAISLERDRPLDRDEAARYRRSTVQNQPGISEEEAKSRLYEDSGTDPFDQNGSGIMWEVIVYDGADALERSGGTDYWWIARGVVNADEPAEVRDPIGRGTIMADSMGFL